MLEKMLLRSYTCGYLDRLHFITAVPGTYCSTTPCRNTVAELYSCRVAWSNPADFCWRVVYGVAVDFVFLWQCYSRTGQRNTLKFVRIPWVQSTSTHIHSPVKLTEQTRGHVQLSTHISANHQLDAIHLEVSGMLLLVLPKCIAVAQVYGCACCIAVRLPHLSPDEAIISPHFKRAISKHDIRTMVFHCWLPGGRIKSQAGGHVDPPDSERWGAVEIAIRRRPRLRVVLDFYLRPRLACFHDRALCSHFASHTRTQHFGVGTTTFQIIFFKTIIFQEKDAIMALKKSKSTAYIFLPGASAYMSANTARSLAWWDRAGEYESRDVQASALKGKTCTL